MGEIYELVRNSDEPAFAGDVLLLNSPLSIN